MIPASNTDLPLMLATRPLTGLLLLLLALAAWIDWREMRIPNGLALGGMVAGVAINALGAQTLAALGGVAGALFVLLPLYAMRALGAGDVKLLAMVGAFLGAHDFFAALLFIVVTAGAFALVVRLRRRPITSHGAPPVLRMPYAPSVFVGTAAFLAVKQLGHA